MFCFHVGTAQAFVGERSSVTGVGGGRVRSMYATDHIEVPRSLEARAARQCRVVRALSNAQDALVVVWTGPHGQKGGGFQSK